MRIESVAWHLRDRGCPDFTVIERAYEKQASVLIGDVADEAGADVVLVPSEAVHSKHVDANQLAEFVAAPLLLLP